MANLRGAGWAFGAPQAAVFCQINGLDFVARSRQLAQAGFAWLCGRKVLTVYIAPNYMYRSGNDAAVLKYDGKSEAKCLYLWIWPNLTVVALATLFGMINLLHEIPTVLSLDGLTPAFLLITLVWISTFALFLWCWFRTSLVDP
jgi:hypothetical protein